MGKKYEAALKWEVQCVGVEWLYQSIERGMSLDAKYFALDIEPANRGEGAWDRNAALKASGKFGLLAPALDKEVPVDFDSGARRRRLRRAGSKVAQEGIWEGILGGVTEAQNQQDPVLAPTIAGDTNFQPFTEEPSIGEYGLDFGGHVNGLFDGLTFYIWGFTDKKVPLSFFGFLICRGKCLQTSSREMAVLSLLSHAQAQKTACIKVIPLFHIRFLEMKFPQALA